MQITYDIYTLFPLLACAIALILILQAWKYRSRKLALIFLVLISTLAWWSLAALLERLSLDLPAKIFWIKMTYPGITILPVAWLLFTLHYTDRAQWLTRRNIVLLSVIPGLTLIMVWTDGWHHLVWKDFQLDTSVIPPLDAVTHNFWFWINAIYAYALILIGDILLLRLFIRSSGIFRKQVGIMLLGSLFPWIANLLFLLNFKPLSLVDPTPLAFSITGIAFYWGLSHLHLLDILPIAHEQILKSMVDGVIVLDSRQRIVEINPAAEKILGRAKSAAVGLPLNQVLPDLELNSSASTQTQITLGEGTNLKYYVLYVSPVESSRRLTGHLVLMHDDTLRKTAEDEARQSVALAAELAERQRTQDALKKSEEKYATIVEKGNDGIIIVQDGLVKFANSKTLEFTGFTLEKTVGKSFIDFVSPECRQLVVERYRRRLAGEDVDHKYEIQILTQSGLPLSVEINANKIDYEGQSADLAIVRDITERKRAEETLRASEARFRSLIENAASGIITTRPDGHILSANKAALEVFGLGSDKPLSEKFAGDMYCDPSDRIRLVENIRKDGFVKNFEVRMKRAGVTPFWASINMIAMTNESRETQFLSIVQDITERKEAAEELARLNEKLRTFNAQLEEKVEERTRQYEEAAIEARASNQAKSDFLASMSHELRTPLNAIIGFSQVLNEQYFGNLNPKQSEYINDIFASGRHLLALINDILDISKVEAGKMELELATVKISDILTSSLTMVKEKAQAHRLQLSVQIAENARDLEIVADERRLKQVVFNLLSNATKFTPDGGDITLSARSAGEEIVVSVSDTGIGISPQERVKLFQPFYQASGGIKDKTPGTGLGLSITKSIVEKHGGRIWLESQGPGKGSCFSFALPVKRLAGVSRT